MTTEQKRVAVDNSALLDAITVMYKKVLEVIAASDQAHKNDLNAIRTTLDQVLSLANKQESKAPRARAGRSEAAAPSGSGTVAAAKTSRFPATAKVWFIKNYTESETERTKYVSMMDEIHALTAYANATPDDKLKKEATLLYEYLKKHNDKSDVVKTIDDAYNAERKKRMQELGHPVAASAAPSAAPAAEAKDEPAPAARAKKPRAAPKPRAAAAKKVGNAPAVALADCATEEQNGEDSDMDP